MYPLKNSTSSSLSEMGQNEKIHDDQQSKAEDPREDEPEGEVTKEDGRIRKKRKVVSEPESAFNDEGNAQSSGDAGGVHNKWIKPSDLPSRLMKVARPVGEMKGHTAFLTFAVRPSLRQSCDDHDSSGGNIEEEGGLTKS